MVFQYSLLVIPGLLIFTVGFILPIFLSLCYSFTSWDGMSKEKVFTGFGNYGKMLHDSYVGDAWFFTLKFTILNTFIQNTPALLFALALDSSIKGKNIFRTILFMPCLLSAIVAGFIWKRMFSNILPLINDLLGINTNFLLFGSEGTVLSGLLVANNWQWIGY